METFALKTVELENFKTWVKRTKINFDKYGLHRVHSVNEKHPSSRANGAGKSSLWDAVCWCLTGYTTEGLRNTDVTPFEGGKPWVKLTISTPIRTVGRSINPTKILLNGKEVSQKQLEENLGFNFDVLTNGIIYGQGLPLFFDRKPTEKLELFSDTLGLRRWDHYSDLARVRVGTLERLETETSMAITSGLEHLETLKGLINSNIAEFNKWNANRERLEEEQDSGLEKLEKELEEATQKRDLFAGRYDMAQTELRPLQKQIRTVAEELSRLELQLARDRATNEAQIAEAVRQYEGLKNAKVCPTCELPVTPTCKITIRRDELKHHIDFLRRQPKVKLWSKDVALTETYKAQIKVLEENEKRFLKSSDKYESRAKYWADIVSKLEATLKQIRKNIKILQKQENPYASTLAELRKSKQKQLQQIADDRDHLKKLKRRIKRYRFWVKGFKDIKLFVIDEVLQELTVTTNIIVQEMGLIGWKVRYSVDKENKDGSTRRGLTVSIKSPETPKKRFVRWESWSGGERQRLRLAGAIAFGDVLLTRAGVVSKFEVIDERTSFLPPETIKEIVSYLRNRAESRRKSIWLVDHHAIGSSNFTSTMLVVRDAEGSRIAA